MIVERPAFLPSAEITRRGFEQRLQHHVIERLREKIGRARFHRLDGAIDVAVRRDHHDRQTFVLTLDALEQVEPGATRHDHIAQHDMRRITVELALGIGDIVRRAHVVTPIRDAQRQDLAQRGFVVDHQN